MSVSSKIKQRLTDAEHRHWAGDNISEYIMDGEHEELIAELTEKFEDVLSSLVIDIDNDPNSYGTGKRLAKMYVKELMSGRYYPAPSATAFPNNGGDPFKGMLVVRSEIKSMCSHHHQPVTGLSKYTRIAQWCARRGTLQEELANDIARELEKATETKHLAVYIQAEHGCCTNRGIMAHSSLTQTTVLKGNFFEKASVKEEFFDNIKMQQAHAPR